MPATACCSLSRSLPGPWPGRTIYFLVLFICYMKTVHCILYVAGHWGQYNIPDSLFMYVRALMRMCVRSARAGARTCVYVRARV